MKSMIKEEQRNQQWDSHLLIADKTSGYVCKIRKWKAYKQAEQGGHDVMKNLILHPNKQ